jgi:hypothetical protein
MTLDEMLLQSLADWHPDGTGTPLALISPDGKVRLSLTADQNDQLACRVWDLSLYRQDAPADLRGWAERLCGRVTGLLEPLRLVEVDAEHNVAQLRSEGPSRRGDGLFYYELMLNGNGGTSLTRYRAPRDGSKRRELVPFAVTHEALAKLTADLLSA